MAPTKRKHITEPGLADVPDMVLTTPIKSKRVCVSTPSSAARLKSRRSPSSSSKTKYVVEKPRADPPRLIVGIDYGTTFSGISHVVRHHSEAKDVEVVTSWPGEAANEQTLYKAPSRIALKSENPQLDEDAWGYEVDSTMKSYSWTKLLLDTQSGQTTFDSSVLSGQSESGLLQLPPNFTAEKLVTLYLSKLYEHTADKLVQTYTQAFVDETEIEFWLTHPATWGAAAKAVTRKVALNAGFGKRGMDSLQLITEPEAAAISIMSRGNDLQPGMLQEKTNVLIADLGGGTIDFQCLTVKTLDPLRTEHTVAGEGGKSGSTYLDCDLYAWMEAEFGEAFKNIPTKEVGNGSPFMGHWERKKHSFSEKVKHKEHRLLLPELAKTLMEYDVKTTKYDMTNLNVVIPGSTIAGFFEGVLNNAFGIIEKQVQALKKGRKDMFKLVFLCGGLGKSSYIRTRFQSYLTEKFGTGCQLVTDPQAWAAVVRGAAIRGLEGSSVVSRLSPMCYGLAVHQAFREGIDDEGDAFVCPVRGKRAHGYIDWFVRRNKRFSADFRAKTNVYLTLESGMKDSELEFHWNMYSYAQDKPPPRWKETGVEWCATISLSLVNHYQTIAFDDNDSNKHAGVPIQVVMRLGGDSGLLVVEALTDQQVVGVAEIDYSEEARTRAVITRRSS